MSYMKEQIELMDELRRIECQLSPENLCCDGEAPRSWVIKEGRRLAQARANVIAQLGYEPSYQELYGED